MGLFFSTKGRIPRHLWWIGVVCLVAANLIAGWVLWDMFDVRLRLFNDGRFALFFTSLALLYIAYCLAVKRFQDRDRSPVNARVVAGISLFKLLLDLVQVTGSPWHPNGLDYLFLAVQAGCGLWFIVELGFMKGTDGDNQYGADPLGASAGAAWQGTVR